MLGIERFFPRDTRPRVPEEFSPLEQYTLEHLRKVRNADVSDLLVAIIKFPIFITPNFTHLALDSLKQREFVEYADEHQKSEPFPRVKITDRGKDAAKKISKRGRSFSNFVTVNLVATAEKISTPRR